MSKDKISDYSTTANSNTDIGGINVDEGCAPSGINDAIRTLMAQLKTWQSGGQDVYIHPAGSASAPSITANGDTNTGIFFPAADTVGITTGGTERARVDSSGNMGVGTTSPTSNRRLDAVLNSNASTGIRVANNDAGGSGSANASYSNGTNSHEFGILGTGYTTYGVLAAGDAYIYASGSKNISFCADGGLIKFGAGTNGTEKMRLDASGNLGIGTTTPNVAGGTRAVTLDAPTAGNYSGFELMTGGTLRAKFIGNSSQTYFGTETGTPLILVTGGTERARIDSSGNLLVGTTSGGGYRFEVHKASATPQYVNRTSNTGGLIDFAYNGSTVGSISTNGTTTTYATSSDYRLKENIAPMTGALAVVAQLKPCTYSWKSTGEAGQGFIAHELQAVLPDAVTGEKDAVNEDGSIKPQGIDTSFLVATLTAAIQELKATVDAQAARITALEQA